MRKVALIAASVVALGWATAHAQTNVDVDVGSGSGSTMGTESTDPARPAPSTTSPSPSTTTPGTTITTPGATVTTPPASNVNVDTGAPGSTNIEVSPSPSTTTTTPSTPSTTTTTPSTPGTSVDINTPSTGDVNVQTAPGTDTDVDVNVPAPATVPESGPAATTGGVTEPEMGVAPAPVTPAPYAAAPAAVDTGEETGRPYGSRLGAGLLVGGGFEDFTGEGMRDITGYGGNWNARLVLGARQFLGIEAAYVGSARNIDALGLENDAVLVSNGAEGALRLNIPVIFDQGRALIAPFGFVGLGWQRYDVTNSNTATSNVTGKDDVMTMPVGGGLALAYGAFMADVRGTYRETWRNDLLRNAGGTLNTWGVSGQVGFVF